MRVEVKLTSDEFRALLPDGFRGLYDRLVESLEHNSGLGEEEAKLVVAQVLLEALRNREAEKK